MKPPLAMMADAQVQSALAGGTAEALLWWTQVPALPGERLGLIGGFRATGAAAAADVLAQAGEALQVHGCTQAVGPMDGSTWRRYRFVTEPGIEPGFFLEPANPVEWPLWWETAGFSPLAQYYSAVNDLARSADPQIESVAARIRAAGITVRPIDPRQFEQELEHVYAVSVVAFKENFLYTPLPRADFIAQYRALEASLQPELVRIAERAGQPVGYMFALPDQSQAQRGEPVTRVVMKTLAIMPEWGGIGLGRLLFHEVHEAARRAGFQRAIHALMHETNKSRRMSAHTARVIRRYTLFAKRLPV